MRSQTWPSQVYILIAIQLAKHVILERLNIFLFKHHKYYIKYQVSASSSQATPWSRSGILKDFSRLSLKQISYTTVKNHGHGTVKANKSEAGGTNITGIPIKMLKRDTVHITITRSVQLASFHSPTHVGLAADKIIFKHFSAFFLLCIYAAIYYS